MTLNILFFLLILPCYLKPIKIWKLKDSNFEKAKEQYPLVVNFFRTDDEESSSYKIALNESLSGLEKTGINVASFDCQQFPKTCKRYNIKSTPILMLFKFDQIYL